MQLFKVAMAVGWIVGARSKAHQHADAVLFRIGRKQLAGDPRRRLVPLRFRPPLGRWHHRLSACLSRDTLREAFPERYRGAQHVGRPGGEGVDDRTERLHLLPAFRTPGDMPSNHGHLAGREGLQGVQEHSAPRNPARAGPTLNSWFLHCLRERLAEFHQSRTDSCLDGSERLIQLSPPPRHTSTRRRTRSR